MLTPAMLRRYCSPQSALISGSRFRRGNFAMATRTPAPLQPATSAGRLDFSADAWTPKGSTMAAITLLIFACALGLVLGAGFTP